MAKNVYHCVSFLPTNGVKPDVTSERAHIFKDRSITDTESLAASNSNSWQIWINVSNSIRCSLFLVSAIICRRRFFVPRYTECSRNKYRLLRKIQCSVIEFVLFCVRQKKNCNLNKHRQRSIISSFIYYYY